MGGKLIEARYDLARRLNLRGMVAGSLIIDYHKAAHAVSARQYVAEVVAGTRFDTNLTKQLKKGFKVVGLIPNYSEAASSLGWGVEMIWENPDYRPITLPRRQPVASVAGYRSPVAG